MNELKIVLKGGLKGCCTQYTATQMKQYTQPWFEDIQDLNYTIIDIEEDYWESEPLADLAYKYFKDKIFPLTYYNNNLVLIGQFPEKAECLEIFKAPDPITEKLITEAFEKM